MLKKKYFLYWDDNPNYSDDSYDDDTYDTDDHDDSEQELSIIDNINYLKWQFEDCPYDYKIDIITNIIY